MVAYLVFGVSFVVFLAFTIVDQCNQLDWMGQHPGYSNGWWAAYCTNVIVMLISFAVMCGC